MKSDQCSILTTVRQILTTHGFRALQVRAIEIVKMLTI